MASKPAHQLAAALRSGKLIHFKRRFKDYSVMGYVMDIGPKFFLMALVCDRIRFDGFECFRLSDVSEVMPHNRMRFIETALEMRGDHMPAKPIVNVASIEELLLSAGRAFPLVTIHTEEVDPGVCWIGKVVSVKGGHVSLLEINPDANWDEQTRDHRLSEITRVNFGADYEEALHLVGGHPP